jgi:hypothetical protein
MIANAEALQFIYLNSAGMNERTGEERGKTQLSLSLSLSS